MKKIPIFKLHALSGNMKKKKMIKISLKKKYLIVFVFRHIPVHDHEEHSKSVAEPFILDRTSRKLLFKKRNTITSYSVMINFNVL